MAVERRFDGLLHMLIPAVVAIIVSVAAAFWSLADPRAELRTIKDQYLTIREHAEFTNRVRSDTIRIENKDDALERQKADKDDLALLTRAIDQRFTETAGARLRELDRLDRQLDELSRRITALADRINNHIEKDSDRFAGKPPR